MRALFFSLLFFPFLAQAGDLEDLPQCLREIELEATQIQRWLPREVFTADRKLFYMTEGIRFLKENAETVLNSLSPVLVTNSVMGCRLFQTQYHDRAFHFELFLVCFLTLVAALTLRVFLIMVSAPLRFGVNVAKDRSSPREMDSRDDADRGPRPRT